MAKTPTPKTVEALKHDEATRKNIPTAEYQSVLEKYQEPFPPSVADRVAAIVRGLWSTTTAPTGTQRGDYAVAAGQFAPLLNNLRTLVEDELKALEATAETAGAPWTPGRVPVWTP